MSIIAATLDVMSVRAITANRNEIDDLHKTLKSIDEVAKAAMDFRTISKADLVATGEARRRAIDAIDRRSSVLLRQILHLIVDVGAKHDLSDTHLMPMTAPALLHATLATAIRQINEAGLTLEVRRGGRKIGSLAPHTLRIEEHDLIADEVVGSWPLDRIAAASSDDGLSFILEDGMLVEMRSSF